MSGEEVSSLLTTGGGGARITTSGVQLAVNSFVEELEDIFVNTDKLLIRPTNQTIPTGCVPEGHQLAKVYEVLDGKGTPGFLLGRCAEKQRSLQFVLYLKSRGSGVLRLKYYGCFVSITNIFESTLKYIGS